MFPSSVKRHRSTLALVALLVSPAVARAQAAYDTTMFGALHWREVGPPRGGRSVAVGGSAARPLEYWMGTTGGGVFKSTDGGMNWQATSDKYFGGTVGAIAVDPQNPDIVYSGGGETDIRGNTSHGDGLWKTADGGKTWTFLGFKEEHISTLRVHPTNGSIVYAGVMGQIFKTNKERGVYKSTDGGKTWTNVLFVNDSTGAIDIAMDPSNPDVLYAGMWQARRTPWSLESGGTGSGLYKSTDGGATWSDLRKTGRGLPQGLIGKTGITVSPAKPSRVWAMIEHDSGGLYRSDDGGATWSWINKDRKLRQRAWYYSNVTPDPKDTNVVYVLNVGFFRSKDGGKTFPEAINVPHGDNHDMWIAPNDPNRMAEANDGGVTVSVNGGKTWTDEDFPTAQFYHVDTTNEFPYKICGAQQDNSTLCGPSRMEGGINMAAWYDAGGGESGYVTPHPLKPDVTFAGSYGGLMTRKDRRTGFSRDITVWPDNPMGYSSKDIKIRFQWTYPIVFSRHNPGVMYAAGNYLYRTTNEGQSWTKVSPDLSRHDPRTMDASGGPITKDQTGVETYALIFAFDESPVQAGLLWAGTDDGYIWISRDAGANWSNVTPKDLGDFTRVSIIEPSPFSACAAYVAANRYQQGDKKPIVYKTTDCGKTWTSIVSGIGADDFARVIRADPVRRGLLFLGTERGVYTSFDDGGHWQSLRKNLPMVPVHDLRIKNGDLIAATHGRSFWVMDDISVLRQLSPEIAQEPVHLFKPTDAYRIDWGGGFFAQLFGGGGNNPPSGGVVYYSLKKPNEVVEMEFLDAAGKVIQHFTSEQDSLTAADSLRGEAAKATRLDSLVRTGLSQDSAQKVLTKMASVPAPMDFEALASRGPRPQRVPNKAGVNGFAWNLRYPDAVRFENLIMWAAGTNGPLAPPGTYGIRLKSGGKTLTQSLVVKKDPRSDATLADLKEQFDFLIKIRDKVTEANNAVRTVRNVRWQAGDRASKLAGKPQEAEFKKLAGELEQQSGEAEREMYQVKNQSSQDPLNFPIKLNNKIAALSGVVSSTEAKPTKQSYDVYNELTAALDSQLKKAKSANDNLLPRINLLLKAAGLEPIVPSTNEPPKTRPNIAM